MVPDHLGDVATPFDALYSALFLVGVVMSIAGVGHVSTEALRAARDWGDGGIEFLQSGAVQSYLVVWVIVEAAIIFQFLRMYYYLHGFDHVRDEQKLKLGFAGARWASRLADRVLRINMAILILTSIKYGTDLQALRRARALVDSLLTELHLATPQLLAPLAIPDEASLTAIRYSLSIIAVFLLLILWDVNNLVHLQETQRVAKQLEESPLKTNVEALLRKAAAFYYATLPETYSFRLRDYARSLKFLERIWGVIFGVASTYAFVQASWGPALIAILMLVAFVISFVVGQQRQGVGASVKVVAYLWSPIACLSGYILRTR